MSDLPAIISLTAIIGYYLWQPLFLTFSSFIIYQMDLVHLWYIKLKEELSILMFHIHISRIRHARITLYQRLQEQEELLIIVWIHLLLKCLPEQITWEFSNYGRIQLPDDSPIYRTDWKGFFQWKSSNFSRV